MTLSLSAADISYLSPSTPKSVVQKYLEPLNKALPQDAIIAAMFLAQVLHESAGFLYQEELASGNAYENRKDLGNIKPGDGKRFKGRGLIQITGRSNYEAFGKFIGMDFINNPALMATLPYCVLSARWFWDTRNCNSLAKPGTEDAFKKVTVRINGGYNGYEDRKQYWNKAKKLLKVS